MEGHWIKLKGGYGYATPTDDAIYFAISLRNVGQGLAVLDHWSFTTEQSVDNSPGTKNNYRRLTKDLYVPAGDIGFWQGTIRDTTDPQFAEAATTIANRGLIIIHIQYADHEGGQRTVSRFALAGYGKDEWLASVARHWRIDGINPR